MSKLKIQAPSSHLIEKTAFEMAGAVYEEGRSRGLTSRFKDARSYARHYFPHYIPKAVDILLSMLGRDDLPEAMKEEIYEALQERKNDPRMQGLTEEVVQHFKSDEPAKPIVINTKSTKEFKKSLNRKIGKGH